jgi:hypothetical protein
MLLVTNSIIAATAAVAILDTAITLLLQGKASGKSSRVAGTDASRWHQTRHSGLQLCHQCLQVSHFNQVFQKCQVASMHVIIQCHEVQSRFDPCNHDSIALH